MILSKPPLLNNLDPKKPDYLKELLIKQLLVNRITPGGLFILRDLVTSEDLSDIIQRIYDLNEKFILELSAVEGIMRQMDDHKNSVRNRAFTKKMKSGFRDPKNPSKKHNKVILAEGDSWFNYPVILTDIIDRIAMEKDMAVFSLASGGDWLLNMLTARHYVEELSILHPNVFLISGGGNDLVGSSRLAAVLDPEGCNEYGNCLWAQLLVLNADNRFISFDPKDLSEGLPYLSRDFFALLMFFHLQYYTLMKGILKSGKFPDIQIITQGYDYATPNFKKGISLWNWYVPLIRFFLGNGSWLKTPLQMRGITDTSLQRKIIYEMIYLFNEMMIDIGKVMNSKYSDSVFHIDSRGSVGKKGWTDELHPKPEHFMNTGKVFLHCIRKKINPTYDHTYVVKQFFP